MRITGTFEVADHLLPILHPEDRAPITRFVFDSSFIEAVTYLPEKRALVIDLPAGVYQYEGVPLVHVIGLLTAQSKGEYYNRFIKNQYYTVKL